MSCLSARSGTLLVLRHGRNRASWLFGERARCITTKLRATRVGFMQPGKCPQACKPAFLLNDRLHLSRSRMVLLNIRITSIATTGRAETRPARAVGQNCLCQGRFCLSHVRNLHMFNQHLFTSDRDGFVYVTLGRKVVGETNGTMLMSSRATTVLIE